jgi:cob(I)alamin adenosyltransferase
MKKGLIQVYTGNGKGKTTAALGIALRAAGHEMKVLMVQFMKGTARSGEVESAKRLSPCLTLVQAGRATFISKSSPDPEEVRLAREGFSIARNAIRNKQYDMVILDEINLAIDYGLIPLDDLLQIMDSKPETVELILTGRSVNDAILERADLVTEMVDKKHYYEKEAAVREGIEI